MKEQEPSQILHIPRTSDEQPQHLRSAHPRCLAQATQVHDNIQRLQTLRQSHRTLHVMPSL